MVRLIVLVIYLAITRSTLVRRTIRTIWYAYNIRFPLISFRPENSYNTMPTNRYYLLAKFYRYQLINSFNPTSLIRVYRNCDKAYSPKKYKIGSTSNRYIKCARKGRSYNLTPFSPTRQARIREQKEDKKKKADKALAYFIRYNKEVSALKK